MIKLNHLIHHLIDISPTNSNDTKIVIIISFMYIGNIVVGEAFGFFFVLVCGPLSPVLINGVQLK